MLRPYLALLLLLCLVRMLLPEAWVLALHDHPHTTIEPAARRRPAGKELLSAQHTHCHTEQFYSVPFAPALPVRLPQPRRRAAYRALVVPALLAASAAAVRRTALRGPPTVFFTPTQPFSFFQDLPLRSSFAADCKLLVA